MKVYGGNSANSSFMNSGYNKKSLSFGAELNFTPTLNEALSVVSGKPERETLTELNKIKKDFKKTTVDFPGSLNLGLMYYGINSNGALYYPDEVLLAYKTPEGRIYNRDSQGMEVSIATNELQQANNPTKLLLGKVGLFAQGNQTTMLGTVINHSNSADDRMFLEIAEITKRI